MVFFSFQLLPTLGCRVIITFFSSLRPIFRRRLTNRTNDVVVVTGLLNKRQYKKTKHCTSYMANESNQIHRRQNHRCFEEFVLYIVVKTRIVYIILSSTCGNDKLYRYSFDRSTFLFHDTIMNGYSIQCVYSNKTIKIYNTINQI